MPLSRYLKPELSLVGVMRPEKITLHSKKSKSVQAGSSPFKIYLSNRGIVANGQMVDVGDSLINVNVLGGVVVFPLMLLYTLISYSVFRGKVRAAVGHY